MSKKNMPYKAVWDTCLDEGTKTKPIKIASLVNKACKDNFDIVRKNIEKGKSEETKARNELSKYIIKWLYFLEVE